MTVAEDVRTRIVAQSVGATVYVGPVRPAAPPAVPFKSVFCLSTGGPPPVPYMDGTATSWRFYRVQCWIRGEPNDFAATQTIADAVWTALHTATISGYTRVTVDSSAPLYLGRDSLTGCHEFTVNCILEKRA